MPIDVRVAKTQYFLPFLLNLCSSDPQILADEGVMTQPWDRWSEKGITAIATFQSTLGRQVEGSLPRRVPFSVSNVRNS